MDEKLNFILGCLEGLHIAIGREGIARKMDLTIEQLEMIKDIVKDIKVKSDQYASN